MGRIIKRKSIYLILILVLLTVFFIRIKAVNENRNQYETYRVNVKDGDIITLGDLELTFGQANRPQIVKNKNQANGQIAVYKLPIEITKNSDAPLKLENKFGVYEKYKDYVNLPLVDYKGKLNDQGAFSSISALKKDETVSLTISTDFILGSLYYYYDDFNIEKPAYIVIAGPQSTKGIPLYYYKLQKKS